MSAMPCISVVTPSFQQAEFIEATLRSVIDQEYEDLEYVVVDGGSTDGSVEIIRRCEGNLAHWISEADNGHAHALNKGFAKTTGDIMCWINSSDMHYPWTLHTVAEVFSALPEVEWIIGVPSQFSTTGGPRSVGPSYMNAYDFLAGNYRWIQQESVFWRRSLWERAGGGLNETLVCAADFDLWLRFLRLAPLYHVGTVLAGFRVHENRLGDIGDGLYERETAALHAQFTSSSSKLALRRARLVRTIASGRHKIIGQWLHKSGFWPWYAHPRVLFDFTDERWTTHR